MKELRDELNKYSKVFIYGAGYYASVIYQALKKVGLKDKIFSFFVTNLNEVKAIDGITVRAASELASYYEKNCIILLALNRENEREVVQLLKEKYGLTEGIKLLDYIVKEEELYERLIVEPNDRFIEKVLGYYIWNHAHSIAELKEKWTQAENSIKRRERLETDKKTIVYISGDLKPRSKKIISALVRKNYHIVVLEYAFINDLIRTEIMSEDVDFFHCQDIIEVLYRALQYKPLVYYFEPDWGDCIGTEIMIRHNNLFGKIVFAAYDVLNDGFVQISEKDKLTEKYCLENADGIVWRWFSKEYLEEKKGFVYKGKSIQFVDCCKGFDIKLNSKLDDRVKLCFVLTRMYGFLDETFYNNDGIFNESARIDTILAKLGNRNDCLFHIFIGQCDNSDREKIEILEKKYTNFKAFYGMRYSELINKISEYDYGCFLMTGGKDIPELESLDNMYYGSVHINSVSNRFFDYLDANLPIISTTSKKLCEYLEKYGVVIKMDLSNLDIDYLKKHKMFYKKNVEKAKEELLIETQITRLIDWFNEL